MTRFLVLFVASLTACELPCIAFGQSSPFKPSPKYDLHRSKDDQFADGTNFGRLSESDQKWILEIQVKHTRIVQQLIDRKEGKTVEIERYTPEEMDAGIATGNVAINTICLQLERDRVAPLSVADTVARFKKGTATRLVKKYIDEAKKRRLDEISWRLDQLTEAKSNLKTATVSDNAEAIKKSRQEIKELISKVESLISDPLHDTNIKPMSMNSLREGQIISLGFPGLIFLQVLDKDTGKALVHHSQVASFKEFCVAGMDLKNVVDGSRFPTGHVFVVRGTTTYGTQAGAQNTVFELHDVTDLIGLSEGEVRHARLAMIRPYDLELTKDDEAALAAAKKEKQKQAETEQIAKDAEKAQKLAAQAQKDARNKAQRAKALVDLGKPLAKKDNPAGARRQFEKAIEESPDSDAGKEAAVLLKSLSKK